jgi:hypothetical protein
MGIPNNGSKGDEAAALWAEAGLSGVFARVTTVLAAVPRKKRRFMAMPNSSGRSRVPIPVDLD